MAKQIFRKTALDRLSSPEQLDQMIKVASPKSWVWLLSMIVLIILTIVWGFLGTIPLKVNGEGMLLKTGGIYEVVPVSSGQLLEVKVSEGDVVYKGQVVARIAQPTLREEIRQTAQRIKDLESQRDEISESSDAESVLKADYFRLNKLSLESEIDVEKEREKWLEERIANQQQLLEQGLITKQTLLQTKEKLFVAHEEVQRKKNQLQQLEVEEYAYNADKRQELIQLELDINNQKLALQGLNERLVYETRIVSPYTGRVIETMEQEGSVVNPGSPILRLELIGGDIKALEAVVYLSPSDGKKVRQGMKIQIAPSTVNVGEHGFITAIVTHVSEYPSTVEGMMKILGNEQLVESLSGGGAPLAVQADLIPDPNTPSGYKWSSSKGPPHKVYSGTLCSGTVILEEQPPVTLVMPFLKRFLSRDQG